MNKEKEYITLKAAAEISGYSPDYIGQLIRAGKLDGKQVFTNVSWVTTEEAIRDYIENNKKRPEGSTEPTLIEWLTSAEGMTTIYTAVVWCAIGIFGVFLMLLLYVFAVSIDHRIEQKNLKQWEETTTLYGN